MKFYTRDKENSEYYKKKIKSIFDNNGKFISLAEVKELFRENPADEERQIGWDSDSDLAKRLRPRACKDGWYLYLPEPNAKICFDKGEPLPNIDVSVFPTESFEKLIDQLVYLRETLEQRLSSLEFSVANNGRFDAGYIYRDCTVKAKKSGRKEERQDRPAKFHRWADLSKGVQQVVALVEFYDGHIEQVQPDRIVFKEVKEND